MNIMTLTIRLIILFSVINYALGAGDGGVGEFTVQYSEAKHRKYSEWRGNEIVISSLINSSEAIVFSRMSENEFVIKQQINSEVYFRFSKKIEYFSPGLDNGILIDFSRGEGYVAALLYGSRGFYFVRATNTPIQLADTKHWKPIKALETEKWNLAEVMKIADPCPDTPGADAGIFGARINEEGQVEFLLADKQQSPQLKTIFSLGKEQRKNSVDFWIPLMKDGKEWSDEMIVNRGYRPFILDEQVEKEMNIRSPSRVRLEWRFKDKDDAVQWYKSNFIDKDAADAVEHAIEKVYSESGK